MGVVRGAGRLRWTAERRAAFRAQSVIWCVHELRRPGARSRTDSCINVVGPDNV